MSELPCLRRLRRSCAQRDLDPTILSVYSSLRGQAGERGAVFTRKFACACRARRCDIGVDFAVTRSVRNFRRSAPFMAVAVLLLGLCASPVTAPFSTFLFYDLSHHAMS